MRNLKYNFKNWWSNDFFKIGFFVLLFAFTLISTANATIYAPGATLEPDCAPGSINCGVSTPALTNIGNSNLTLTGVRNLTLDGFTLTFEGTSFDVVIDDNGDISVGGGDISTPSSGLTLQANTINSGTIQIGSGVASTTPDLLVVDLKSDAGDPAGTNGAMYYNDNTDKMRCFENGAWGDCIFQSNGSGQNLTLARIGSSTFSTLQDLQNVFHSAGWVSGGAITDAGGGNIDIAAGSGLIRSSNTATATVSYFDWTALNGVSIPLDSVRYVGIEYNAGSPQVSVRTTDNWNLKTDFPIGAVFNEGGTLFIYSDLQAVGDHAANMIQREHETMPLSRDERNGGIILGEDGTRNVTLSAGAIWDRLNRYIIPAINTSISGDFTSYYRDGGSGFTRVTGLTQWPNDKFDDGSGTLANITAGKFATLWFYVDTGGDLIMIYGRDEYNTASLADAEMEPDTLPERVMINSKLVGKIIFQEGAGVASDITSAFSMSSTSSINSNHANLTGLDYASSGHTGFANAILGVNNNITSVTALSSITPVGALTITSGAASVWSTSAGALTLDSAAALNLGTTNATALNLGRTGITTTNSGDFSIIGNYITPKGADYPTTGAQNDVNLGTGFLFRYTGAGSATFTGFAGGVDGKIVRIINASASNLIIANQNIGSVPANRIITASSNDVTVAPDVAITLQYDSGVSRWRIVTLPVTALTGTIFLQGGNGFGTTATLGTTDANALNLITSGATRFSVASGGATLTGTGATSITTDNTLSLSSAVGSALSVTSGTTGALNLDSGTTGAINIGNNANAKTITVGNIIGATSVNVNTGTGGSTFTTTNGVFNINSGTGAINIGTDAVAKTLTIGNVTGATSLNLNAGSGGGIFTSSSGLTLNPFGVAAGNTTEVRFAELVANGSHYIGFKAPDILAGNVIWVLPDADGNPGDILTTDGSNNLSWSTSGACVGCVVNSSKFNVDAPTGNITEINDVATSFPALQGASGDVLTNDGAGNLTWSPVGAGSAALSSVSAATGNATIANGNNNINWNWSLSGVTNAFNISENVASTGTGYLQRIATIATSTAKPFSLGARGTTIFDTTATGGLTLGDSATLNTPITLQSGTGAINIGTDAVAKTITVGNTTGATAVNINSGSGGISLGGNTTVSGTNTFTTGTGTTTFNSTAINLAGNSTVIDMTGTGTLGLNTTTNRAITTGTGLLTVGGALTANGTFTQGGDYATPKGTDYTTTGTQNNVNLGTGSLFKYTGAGTATFTGITGGTDGRFIRITNASASNLVFTNQDVGSTAANRIITSTGGSLSIPPDVSVGFQYDVGVSRWRTVVLPATSGTLASTVFLQGGNAFSATGVLGTTDANGLNLITSGATRFALSAGSSTLTGTGATTLTSTGSVSVDATTSLNLGTSTATSISLGGTGITTTNNGFLTSAQTLTASDGFTLSTGALNLTATSGVLTLGSTTLAGGSPLVFEGATVDANETTFVITDPTAARTITFPNASITVNAAANISGTTLASNVVTSSLSAVGALFSGSIASGFGTISTTSDITTSSNISTTGTGTISSAGALTASSGFTLTTGALNLTGTSGALSLSGLSASSINTGANNITFTSGNITTTATGINSTAIGATTASTGAFTTLSSTGGTNLGTTGASNVNIATTGTGNVVIGNATGTFSLASSGGLNVTTGGALTGVVSIDTIATSATALTFAGAGTISSTTTSAITLDSGTTGAVNIGTGANAKTITFGNTTGATSMNIRAGTGSILLSGQATGTSATFLGLPVKTDAGDPTTTQINGAMYYNSSSNKFRCFENSAWKDCDATPIPSVNSFTDSTLAATWTDADTNELWDDTTRPNITPSASTSEILVMVTVRGTVATSGGGDTNNPVARIDREIGVTADCADTNTVGPTIGDLYLESGVTEVFEVAAIFVDAPATTSNVSYTICSSADSGGLSDTTTATRTEVTLFEVNDAADLAEIYSTNDVNIGMGDVVSLDSTLEFGVQKSSSVNDKKVVGIVSSKPAMVLGGINDEGEGAVPVALSGRVPVKVVTENGAIEAGDYLSPSSTPGVAMKSNGTGVVIGQAMSGYDAEGIGFVTAFVKNFDLGNVGEVTLLLGSVSPKINPDGTDNGLATLVVDIQSEIARDPVVVIGEKISNGQQFLTDFVSARVTAVRGYYDEIFTKKIHSEQICINKANGEEVCVGGDQLEALLNNANIEPIIETEPIDPPEEIATPPSEETIPVEENDPSQPIPEDPAVEPDVTTDPAPQTEPETTPEPTPETELSPESLPTL